MIAIACPESWTNGLVEYRTMISISSICNGLALSPMSIIYTFYIWLINCYITTHWRVASYAMHLGMSFMWHTLQLYTIYLFTPFKCCWCWLLIVKFTAVRRVKDSNSNTHTPQILNWNVKFFHFSTPPESIIIANKNYIMYKYLWIVLWIFCKFVKFWVTNYHRKSFGGKCKNFASKIGIQNKQVNKIGSYDSGFWMNAQSYLLLIAT